MQGTRQMHGVRRMEGACRRLSDRRSKSCVRSMGAFRMGRLAEEGQSCLGRKQHLAEDLVAMLPAQSHAKHGLRVSVHQGETFQCERVNVVWAAPPGGSQKQQMEGLDSVCRYQTQLPLVAATARAKAADPMRIDRCRAVEE